MWKQRYITNNPTEEELLFQSYAEKISLAFKKKDRVRSQYLTNEWASLICDKIGIRFQGVWKFFKRDLVAHWFGSPEKKRFSAGWSVEEVFEYVSRFENRIIRFSLFPVDIACHATSHRLPLEKKNEWKKLLRKADNPLAMEIFPESSTSDSICFRRFSTLFGEDIFYEAGKGQAMYVFESEQGSHPVIIAERGEFDFSYKRIIPDNANKQTGCEIENKLRNMIKLHEGKISTRCCNICRALGIEYVSIEGYYDPKDVDRLIVLDLDIPLDVVFMGTECS